MRKKICSCEKTDKWIRKTNEMPNVPDWPHPGAQCRGVKSQRVPMGGQNFKLKFFRF